MKRYRQCIMGTCCVPWNEDFTFAEDLFRQQVRMLIRSGIHDLYVFGTAGEGYAVSESQFDRITRVFLDETAQPDVQPIVGVLSLSLPAVIERIERAKAMGARRFQLSLPSWGALNDPELAAFFRETCGRFPDCEFMHYNLMRTKRLLTPAEYGELEDRHPNLVAAKNSSSDPGFIAGLLTSAPRMQHFIGELGFVHGARLGECGLLISLAAIQPALAARYVQAAWNRDDATLAPLVTELEAIRTQMKTVVARHAHMDGAYDKLICKLHDPRFPLRLLPPYSAIPDSEFDAFANFVRTQYPRWMPEPITVETP